MPDEDPDVVSPPHIVGPLYACVDTLQIENTIPGAEVYVEVQGGSWSWGWSDVVSGRSSSLTLPSQLEDGQQVVAWQVYQGGQSAVDTAAARSHLVDYPNGLPAPSIDPTTVHQCASRVGVRAIPGSIITVYKNNGSPRATRAMSRKLGRTIADAAGPFVIGDELRASMSLCGQEGERSWPPVTAKQAPSQLPTPSMETIADGDTTMHVGSLVEGVEVDISEVGVPLGHIQYIGSWPLTMLSTNFTGIIGRTMLAADRYRITQSFPAPCGITSPPLEVTVPSCEGPIESPRVATPMPGDDFVLIIEARRGAIIRVWANNEMIGKGTGNAVRLVRTLRAGEEVKVTQAAGYCPASRAYRVEVQGPGSEYGP